MYWQNAQSFLTTENWVFFLPEKLCVNITETHSFRLGFENEWTAGF
jgi:hypothetical protein